METMAHPFGSYFINLSHSLCISQPFLAEDSIKQLFRIADECCFIVDTGGRQEAGGVSALEKAKKGSNPRGEFIR